VTGSDFDPVARLDAIPGWMRSRGNTANRYDGRSRKRVEGYSGGPASQPCRKLNQGLVISR
jgi:hypothetical protein